MTNSAHLIARSNLRRTDKGYEGTANVWGFLYHVTVERLGDTIQLSVYDGPVAPEHRIPGVDGAL